MDFEDLGPAMSAAADRDDVAKVRKDLAFIASVLLEWAPPDPFLERELGRISKGQTP